MSQYRKILLIADPAQELSPALVRATALATSTGAELQLCVFEHSAAIATLGRVNHEVAELAKLGLIEERERWLRAQAVRLQTQGLRVKTRVIWGKPVHEQIVATVIEQAPDLVVKDIHHEPLLKRVLFTPLDWQLLRLCPAPLLMVSASAHTLPQRVIAAVDTAHEEGDGGELNERIVHAAVELALQCNASLHLLESFEETFTSLAGEMASPQLFVEAWEQLRESQRAGFNAFAARHSVAGEQRHFLQGPAHFALANFSRQTRADVLVLGSNYRRTLDRILLGSTAEKILGDLRCDVLVVKRPGFLEDLESHRELDGIRRRAKAQWAEPLELEQV